VTENYEFASSMSRVGGDVQVPPAGSWGPDGRAAAVSITFDNLGEAGEIAAGVWPDSKPLGQHSSIENLPMVLSVLEEEGVRSTFFVEGGNTDIYPDAVRSIAERHEIGCHGLCHELWHELEPQRERDLLARALRGYRELGIPHVSGFRPPGGRLTRSSFDILREFGFHYVSPVGEAAAVEDGFTVLPFKWETIDGFHVAPEIRDPPRSSEQMLDIYQGIVDKLVADGGYLSFVFHPIWLDNKPRIDALRTLIQRFKRDERLWLAPCGDVSDFIRANT
jgi:peptidoglycan/xylan/chitin deacetylase (PgdA/CDA1 family)